MLLFTQTAVAELCIMCDVNDLSFIGYVLLTSEDVFHVRGLHVILYKICHILCLLAFLC